MTGIPTIQVLLDDGTGTYPVDLTSRTSLSAGITVSGVGRGDEFSTPGASTLSLTLDNNDGTLSGGGPGFDTLPFGTGPFGGGVDLAPGVGIRYIETIGGTTRTRFTGRIISLDQGWPGGVDTWSTVVLQATDDLARLGGRPMRSMLEEEILLSGPTAYYLLGEAQGSTSAGDTSGNQAPSLRIAGTGAPVTFGSGTGPVDGLTAATFAGGKYLLRGTESFSTAPTAPTVYALGCAFSTTSGAFAEICAARGWYMYVNSGGKINVQGPGILLSSKVYSDGNVHTAILVCDGTTVSLVVDGAVDGSSTLDPGDIAASLDVPFHRVGDFGFTGAVSHFAEWSNGLTVARAQAITSVASGSTETTDARLSRLASYAGMTATTTTPSGQLMGTQATTGQSLFDALQAVAAAEGGLLYIDGSGVLTLLGRYHTGLQTTPLVIVDGDTVDPGTVFSYDTQQLINQVTVTRTGGATQLVSSPAVLANRNEPIYAQSLDLAVATDADALGHAQWVVGKYDETTPRIGSATLDLLTASDSVAADLLGLNVGDHIALTGLPGQLWANTGDVVVQGWSETLQVSGTGAQWTITENLLPWDLAEVGIYDDAGSLYETAIYGY